VIEFRGITKRFGSNEILRGVDLTLGNGKVLGLVGPNGAGKSTLIKMLLGLVHPTAGEILIDGKSIAGDDSYRGEIGYMPQIARFPENLTAAELFSMVASLREGEGDATADHGLTTRLSLDGQLDKPLRVLSGGTRQKVNAALALWFRPRILVLDEPTAGLDPRASAALKDEIQARTADGATVLVTSHIMSELEDLCDTVAFLLDGAIRYLGPISELTVLTHQANLERAIAALMIREVA
jgi:Cu-processing system ATP-binding protein